MTTTGPSADLDLLRLADPVPTPPRSTPANVARVVAAARTRADHPATRPTPRRARRPRRRFVLAVGTVAVAAGAVSVAVAVLPGGERVGVRPPAAAADPVAVLRAAATSAAARPFTPPRADQFVFIDSGDSRWWRSVDGARDGRVDQPSGSTTVPGCRDGVALVAGNYEGVRPQPCTPEPAYRADIPTDPAALRAWLVAQGNGSETNNVAKEVLYLLGQTLLAPDVQAALFTAVSTYPGLAVTTEGVPPGEVAVTWQMAGSTNALFFSASDHRYRGVRAGEGGSTASPVVVVDAVGQTS